MRDLKRDLVPIFFGVSVGFFLCWLVWGYSNRRAFVELASQARIQIEKEDGGKVKACLWLDDFTPGECRVVYEPEKPVWTVDAEYERDYYCTNEPREHLQVCSGAFNCFRCDATSYPEAIAACIKKGIPTK